MKGKIIHCAIRPMCFALSYINRILLVGRPGNGDNSVVGFPSLKQQTSRELNFQCLAWSLSLTLPPFVSLHTSTIHHTIDLRRDAFI